MSSVGAPRTPRVRLLARAGCHLCDDARAVVAAVCTELGVQWEEREIDEDPALLTAYAHLIPVVLVDGVEVAHWRVDPASLADAVGGR